MPPWIVQGPVWLVLASMLAGSSCRSVCTPSNRPAGLFAVSTTRGGVHRQPVALVAERAFGAIVSWIGSTARAMNDGPPAARSPSPGAARPPGSCRPTPPGRRAAILAPLPSVNVELAWVADAGAGTTLAYGTAFGFTGAACAAAPVVPSIVMAAAATTSRRGIVDMSGLSSRAGTWTGGGNPLDTAPRPDCQGIDHFVGAAFGVAARPLRGPMPRPCRISPAASARVRVRCVGGGGRNPATGRSIGGAREAGGAPRSPGWIRPGRVGRTDRAG